MPERPAGAVGRGPEVVTLGECLIALVATDYGPLADARTFSAHVAGAEANVAVGLARLEHAVAFVGRVGADGFGTAILRSLRGNGVGVDQLKVDSSAPTGLLIRDRRAIGPSEVVYYRSASAGSRLGPEDVDRAVAAGTFERARWLHLTGITPALSPSCRAAVERAIERAREERLTVSLDVNLRRKLWSDDEARPVLADVARRVDVLLAGGDEAAVMAGVDPASTPEMLVDALLKLGPSTAVVKLGAEGAIGRDRDGPTVRRHGLRAAAIDPIGAGDAFSAGFISAQLDGASLERALDVANACGAAAVSALGDQSGLPDRLELERLLAPASADAIR
jgi:2-dehydro-3-deoxygluconokinase